MRLVLVLPLRNQDALDSLLKELYDPSSASYRRFLTVKEFTARFGPSQEDYDEVIRFAEAHGLVAVGTSRNRMNLDVTGSVANVEEAFHLIVGVYQYPGENHTFYAPDREPTLDLPFQLWHIAGLDNYSIPRPLFRRANFRVNLNATTGSGPGASFLGSDMRAAYYGGTALTGTGQSVGLLEFYGTDLADLETYYENVGQTNDVPISLFSTDGTSTSCLASAGCDDTEQTVDMTQTIGVAPGLSSLVMYVGSTDSAILNAMATASPLNAQLSSSWTWTPVDPSTDDPYFEEFAAQGQNLFQAAGDDGAWSASSGIFPADDVYVTSVGGTDLETSGVAGPWLSETAWADSGGGISPDEFPIPLGRRPRPADVQAVPRLIATARTFRQTRISLFTSAPTRLLAPLICMVVRVLLRRCGPATWLWPTNRQSLMATTRLGSSTRVSIRLVWARTMTVISTILPVAATAIRQPPVTMWRPAGAVRTGPD
jgi:kumamolisin